MLGVAQELEVRLALGINADTAAQSIAIEGTACTLLAKVDGPCTVTSSAGACRIGSGACCICSLD